MRTYTDQKIRNSKIELFDLLNERRRRELENSFYEFVKDAFMILHNGESMIDNWHVKYLCDLLQNEVIRISKGINKQHDIIINISPRSLKSFITTICLPAWAWIIKPSLKFIGSSYSADLSVDHNIATRRIVESFWYKSKWGELVVLSPDQNTKSKFENTATGSRRATSTGGAITGSGANIIIVDDPINPEKARSELERDTANRYFDQTLTSRLNTPMVDMFVIIMQRLHENDLTGYLLRERPGSFKHICIPAEIHSNIYPEEIKTYYQDGLFFPHRFSHTVLKNSRNALGSFGYAGQMLQAPTPEEGGIFKKAWAHYYNRADIQYDYLIDAWDCTFKDTVSSDYVGCTVWGIKGANRYLIYALHERMGFVKTIEKIQEIRKRFRTRKTIVEDKANGSAVIDMLNSKIGGLIAFNPGSKSKIERAYAVTPLWEAGNVLLPVKDLALFDLEDYLDELWKFPNAFHDDLVDSTTMALLYLNARKQTSLRRFSKI